MHVRRTVLCFVLNNVQFYELVNNKNIIPYNILQRLTFTVIYEKYSCKYNGRYFDGNRRAKNDFSKSVLKTFALFVGTIQYRYVHPIRRK